ncbi:endonuclease [Niastella koreensis]|uniref:DNA/RNA non-specific endonuclease n=2 Tax=Niastella koreensis TaxID=354356 RepID=G8TQ44_NIAKG|nr:DNA/RNA non-specific endonuclease [Niastella koreensis]AEW01045.1 DNA/RNA non-specific endonuclease [Niastella koreensis GR20-10]OQP42649.1 endonuclease [Niastella koreensis]
MTQPNYPPLRLLAAVFSISLLFAACKKDLQPTNTNDTASLISPVTEATTLTEGFESGSKTAYAAADVTLSSGSWNLNDALIGNLSTDVKSGAQSARVRNSGSLTMNFDVTGGVSSVTVKHAVYGSDAGSTWELRASTNGGSTFTRVGSTITTSSTTLQTATFTVSYTGNVRFAIVKTDGSTNRINIDDITISSSSTGGGTGGGTATDDDNMMLGNPSGATASTANFTNYLMVRTYYTLSYHRDRGTPNWVSWHIKSGDLGSTDRQDDFRADVTLPSGWYEVGATSYSGSGFDRGHNCPSADRTSSVDANQATFLMTNMIPQAPNNNEQTWANMENYIRTLVTAGNEVYVVMGSYGTGGTGSSGTVNTIDGGHVTVPNHIWKVVVVLPNGNGDLARITSSTRVIAVNTPNINTVNSDWKTYRTSVDAIESATGYDLLSNVSTAIQSTIEAKVDNQ